ncbi:MAG: hypothetical protein IAF38_18490 [Bacteroidia bacterium]|nr:hypothetical protein [Bacteroidia bacterium]
MKITPSRSVIAFIMLVMLWASSNLNWGKDYWRGIVESDAKGYYAYLPATFIYNDLNFGFFDSIEKVKYFDEHYYYDYRTQQNTKTINKYFCGTAVMQIPFFFASHIATKFSPQDADGFSKYYCIGINLAGIFYLFIGILFLKKLLRLYSVSEWTQFWVLPAIVFGTNLFYYSVVEPGMSHVYSFALIACFLVNAKKMCGYYSSRRVIYIAILLALIFLIRPANILIVFSIPFLAGTKESFFVLLTQLKKDLKHVFISLFLFVIISSLQFIIYKISCGSFFVYSYGAEGFNFATPHMIDILFSYRKGLFLYTPIYLVCLSGIYFMFKRSKWEGTFFTLFFLLLTYVLSSWWSWWYGGSYSSRVYVEFLPLFAVCLALTLQQLKGVSKKIVTGFVVLLILFCQVQTYQYRYNQITWDEMTKEKYWNVFMRVDKLT